MNKAILQAILATLALVLFIVVAGIFYVEKNNVLPFFDKMAKKEKGADKTSAIQSANVSPKTENRIKEIVETGNTAGWRQYGNQKYEYRIKYPGSLNFSNLKEKKFLGADAYEKLDIRKNPETFIDVTVRSKDIDIYADDLEKNLPYEELTINGQKAVRLDTNSSEFNYSETTIYGPKYSYQISLTEKGGRSLQSIYDQLISTFVITSEASSDKLNYWELVSGNPKDSCSSPTYIGYAEVNGWYSWDYVYVEKGWVLNLSPEDAKKLPIEELLGGTEYYDQFIKKPTFIMMDASKSLEDELKQASPENPVKLNLQKFKMYCEGAPQVGLSPVIKTN